MSLLASVQCECGLHATIKNHTKYCLFIILFCINAKSVQCSALFLHFSSSCHACNVPNKMRECTTHSEHSIANPKLLFTMCNNINFAKMPRKILFYFLSFLMRVLWLVVVVARLLHDGNLFIDFLVLFVFVRLFFFFFVSFYFILISGRAHTLTHSLTHTHMHAIRMGRSFPACVPCCHRFCLCELHIHFTVVHWRVCASECECSNTHDCVDLHTTFRAFTPSLTLSQMCYKRLILRMLLTHNAVQCNVWHTLSHTLHFCGTGVELLMQGERNMRNACIWQSQ